MKLVYLHQYFVTPSESGGTRSFEFAKRLAVSGIDVHMVTTDRGPERIKGWRAVEMEGFTVHTVSVPYSQKMSYARRIRSFAEFAVRASAKSRSLRGDVIFATSTPLTIILPALYAKAFRRIPLVFEVRDLWPEMPIAMGALNNPVLRSAARLLEKIAYSCADMVVALSPGMEAGVLKVGKAPEAIEVIPNSSDLALFDIPASEGEQWRRQHPELGDRKIALYAGSMGKVNNLSYLVDIAASVAERGGDVVFVIIGRDGSEKQALSDYATERKVLGSNLFLLPQVPKTEIPRIYSAATIALSLVVPLKQAEANSANKIFDSFAAGKPLVINHGGWQKELLELEGAGIAVPGNNAEQAAIEIIDLVQNPELLAEMSRNSIRLARDRFSRDLLAQKLERVIRRAAAGHARR